MVYGLQNLEEGADNQKKVQYVQDLLGLLNSLAADTAEVKTVELFVQSEGAPAEVFALATGLTPYPSLKFSLSFHNNYPIEQANKATAINVLPGGECTWTDLTSSNLRHSAEKLSSDCGCTTCSENYSMAYLHHLFDVKELNASILTSIHNLWQYQKLLAVPRQE